MARDKKKLLASGAVLLGCSLLFGALTKIADPVAVSWWHYVLGAVLGGVVLALLRLVGILREVVGLPEMSQSFPPGYLLLFRVGLSSFAVGALAFILIAHELRNVGFLLGAVAVASGLIAWFLMGLITLRGVVRRVWK